MNTKSFSCSRFIRCSISLSLIAALAIVSAQAVPKQSGSKKSKNNKARVAKKPSVGVVKKLAPPVQKAKATTASVTKRVEPEVTPSQIPYMPVEAAPEVSQIPYIPSVAQVETPKAKTDDASTVEAEAASPAKTTAPEANPKAGANSVEELDKKRKEAERTFLAAPLRGNANWQARWRNTPMQEVEQAWYSACYTNKDDVLCENFSQLIVRHFAESAYLKTAHTNVINYGKIRSWGEFQIALKDYYSDAPNAAKLTRLFQTGDPLLYTQYVLAQMVLAGTGFGLTHEFREPEQVRLAERVKTYLEIAFRVFAPAEGTGKEISKTDWENFRRNIFSSGNQFLGFYALKKEGNPEEAVLYLNRAIAVKGDDKLGWKDPLSYYLRTDANNKMLVRVNQKYTDLPKEQRNGDIGKTLLIEIETFYQRVAEDYARILVVTQNSPEYKAYRDYAESNLRGLMGRKPNPEAAYQELIKRIQSEFVA